MVERKTALITGAASGIGLETARRFLQDSRYNPIYAVDRDSSVYTIFPSLEYPNVVPLKVDVRDRDSIEDMLEKVAAESGRLDVVVNAAGVMYKGQPAVFWDKNKALPQEWEEMDRVNLWAPIIIMTEAPRIMSQNGGGTIINITSAKYLFPDIHHIEYQKGKMQLSKVTRGLAKDWMKDYKVRLVDVQPGNTKTNIDRGIWTEGNSRAEMETAESITNWWREHFGNDPKNVAEVVYNTAEGNISRTTILIGLDAQIGRALFLATYPLAGYRWDTLFLGGSTIFYKFAEWGNMISGKFDKLTKK